MSIAAQILEIATEKGVMLTCAESCTGGMVVAALTDIPGSSAVVERGFRPPIVRVHSANVSARRYFCTQCHVPQADAQPLVENTFKPVTAISGEE